MARPRSTSLTTAQKRVAQAIARIERSGFPATLRALVEELKLAGISSLAATLRIMNRNGYVEISGGGSRGKDQWVRLTREGRYAIGEGGIPLLGVIQAGLLEEAQQEPEAIFETEDILPYRPGDFLLKVRGDSMQGDGILEGDYVLIRPTQTVERGEIAAVLVGEEEGTFAGGAYEATLKRVYVEGDQIRLKASNPAYPDQVLPACAVKIAGVFKGLIRHAYRG